MKRGQLLLLAGSLLWGPAAAAEADSFPPARVAIRDHAFVPRIIHVRVGQQIIWMNYDQDPHTVTSGGHNVDDGRWKSSPLIPDGGTFSLRLAQPGTYPYFCKPHYYEEKMHGTIIVSPS